MAVQVLRPALAALLLASCASNHRVSPFPEVDLEAALAPADDLEGQRALALREARGHGLSLDRTIEGKLPSGKPFLALGFSGLDPAGRPVHAARVVTPASVVLALGPPRLAGQASALPCELLPSLLPSGAYPSGVDLSGDRAPDVALRAEDGSLHVYRVDLRGASPYPVSLRAPPTSAVDANEDGRPDLTGAPPIPDGDSIRPDLADVAIADGTSFRNDHPSAVAFHKKLAAEVTPAPADAPLPLKLRRALERAFHESCAGAPLTQALQPAVDLAVKHHPLPADVAASWVRWRGFLADSAIK